MNPEEYIQLGLNGDAPLKVIMCGKIGDIENSKIGVVSVVYATMDKQLAEEKFKKLSTTDRSSYYMVYSVPLDVDLTTLDHYPSIAITKEDLI